ncbi:MAG TPA: hypothetical protein VHA76_11920 [Solirubrobacterales bacterium]|nr:hypothetical protein [Solirubrobacterales bacterium]
MLVSLTEFCLVSAEEEVDAEFVVAAGLEAMVEAESLAEYLSIEVMQGIY